MSKWNKEPDHVEFEEKGLRALILRNKEMGHLNGYLAVPRSHVLYGMTDIPDEITSHKGWTYTSELNPATGKDDGGWWIGFDCAHAGDQIPYFPSLSDVPGLLPMQDMLSQGVYRDLEYVRETLKQTALDVHAYMGPNIALFRA